MSAAASAAAMIQISCELLSPVFVALELDTVEAPATEGVVTFLLVVTGTWGTTVVVLFVVVLPGVIVCSVSSSFLAVTMVYYSEKYARKQRADRERVIAKAIDLINNPKNYTRATCYGAAGYVENISFCKDTGEVAESLNLSLNQKKIDEEAKYDGYYSIVTSEMELSDSEIRNIYSGLWEIEESFKIMKSEFKARPVFVRNDEHINSHFLICFTTLVIMRVLEHLLKEKYTTKQIRTALINYSCSYLEQNYYLFDYRDNVLDEFSTLYGWNLAKKYMTKSEIKKILKHHKNNQI